MTTPREALAAALADDGGQAVALLHRGIALMQFVADRGPDAGYWRGDAADWVKRALAFPARLPEEEGP